MVCAAEILGVRGPVGPAICQGRFVPLGGRGFLPPDRNRHGDDEWNKVVVSRLLRVHTLLFCGTPRPVWLLTNKNELLQFMLFTNGFLLNI